MAAIIFWAFIYYHFAQAQSPPQIVPPPAQHQTMPTFGEYGGANAKPINHQQSGRHTLPHNVNASIQEQNIRMIEADMYYVQQSQKSIPLPDFRSMRGTEHYFSALAELSDMLIGKKPLSIKRAVYLTENAFFENRIGYDKFNLEISNIVEFCNTSIEQQGLNGNDDMVKKMMIMRYVNDTLTIGEKEKFITHYPMTYDFEDYRGAEDLSKQFVSKLLMENTGQCRSMPLLYLILAEEMKVEAFLSVSPNHTFIKIRDKSGRWYNLEATNGHIYSDYHYIQSGFISNTALKNRIYLEPLAKKQAIALTITDLASGYIRKFGYDDFVRQCLDLALSYYPNSITAHMIKANYHTAVGLYVLERSGAQGVKDLPRYPQAEALYNDMQQSYRTVDSLGHIDMPESAYQRWLMSMEKEKARQASQPKNIYIR